MLDSLVKVTLPEMGESVTEGSIVEWRKKVGQWVDEGDTLVDVTTDKVDVEVPVDGLRRDHRVHGAEGDTIAVGAVLVEIDTDRRQARRRCGRRACRRPASDGRSRRWSRRPATARPDPRRAPAEKNSTGNGSARRWPRTTRAASPSATTSISPASKARAPTV